MGVSKYTARGKTWWRVDEWLTLPDGKVARYRKKRIPTKEQANMLAAKVKAETFEGRFFVRQKEPTTTVRELWDAYEPITKRDNDSWQTNIGRSRHLLRHLGQQRATQLSLKHVDEYRNRRLRETTKRGDNRLRAPLTVK